MLSRFPILLLAVTLGLLGACAPNDQVMPAPEGPTPPYDMDVPPGDATPLAFTQLAYGSLSPVGAAEAVYRTEQEWAAVREGLGTVQREPDFPAEGVLLAAIEAPTGGYQVRFESVAVEVGDQVVARYTVEEPGDGCMVTQALTQPFAVVAVRALPEGAVLFIQSRRAVPCP